MPLEDSIKDREVYFIKRLRWYEKIWYFIRRKKNKAKKLGGVLNFNVNYKEEK